MARSCARNRRRLAALATGALCAIPLAAAPAAAQRVGVTAAVNQATDVDRTSGRRTVVIGENILFEDRIITSGTGLAQILFVDGSAFTIGANSRVVIDRFVFDPATGTGELVSEVTEGALRFVGGKLSKRGNTVRLRTPVGTLGVRGGIVNIDLGPACQSDGRCPAATASLVFGDSLTLTTTAGRTYSIHEPGYTFLVGAGGVDIVPTATIDQSDMQARLAGRSGQSGGATQVPTNATVVRSAIASVNSDRAPATVLPRPRPLIVRTRYTPEAGVPGVTDVIREVETTLTEPAQADLIDADVREIIDEAAPRGPDVTLAGARTPAQFVTTDGVTIADPARVGIVTPLPGNAAVDGTFVVLAETGERVAIDTAFGRLPFPAEPGTTAEFTLETSGFFDEPARGVVVRGPDGAALYYLQPDRADGALDEVVYLGLGTPTPVETFFPGEERAPLVRTYTLSPDFQRANQGISTVLPLLNPLVAREFGDEVLTGATVTDFIIADAGAAGTSPGTLYGGLVIDGSGADQRSALALNVGSIVGGGEDLLAVVGSRRGSYRLDAGDGAVAMRGPTGSSDVVDDDATRVIYGRNGNNFVLTSGIAAVRPDREGETLAFFDDQQNGTGLLAADEAYSSTVVLGNLEGADALGDRQRTLGPTLGFAAGTVETEGGAVRGYRSSATGDFTLVPSEATSTVGGVIVVDEALPVGADVLAERYAIGFGDDITGTIAANGRVGTSTFVDDDTYGAIETGRPGATGSPTTQLTTRDGTTLTQVETSNPATYMVPSTLMPQPGLFAAAGVEECECAFLEWGWWGTQTELDDGGDGAGGRRDFVHLGTWAAGEVTPSVDLPTTGEATFAGHAVGNVTAGGGANTAQYVAAGRLTMDFDFGARTGNLAIDDFDGRSFSGSVTEFGAANGGALNQFGGRLAGSGVTGSADGAFVNGPDQPAQGVVGAFDVRGGAYGAVGTFVGER